MNFHDKKNEMSSSPADPCNNIRIDDDPGFLRKCFKVNRGEALLNSATVQVRWTKVREIAQHARHPEPGCFVHGSSKLHEIQNALVVFQSSVSRAQLGRVYQTAFDDKPFKIFYNTLTSVFIKSSMLCLDSNFADDPSAIKLPSEIQ